MDDSTTSKTCSKCGEVKPLTEFYRNPAKPDGFQYNCKACMKETSRAHYLANRDAILAHRKIHQRTPEAKAKKAIRDAANREKRKAKQKIYNTLMLAIRAGEVERKPCEVCGNPLSEGHHDDYSKPLEVRWLCFKHHREIEHGQIVTNEQDRERARLCQMKNN